MKTINFLLVFLAIGLFVVGFYFILESHHEMMGISYQLEGALKKEMTKYLNQLGKGIVFLFCAYFVHILGND